MGIRLSQYSETDVEGGGLPIVDYGSPALNSIGDSADLGAQNVISGNGIDGVYVAQGSIVNQVDGNYIGTNPTGRTGIGNTRNGVSIIGSRLNIVGGLNSKASLRDIVSVNSTNPTSLYYSLTPIAGGIDK